MRYSADSRIFSIIAIVLWGIVIVVLALLSLRAWWEFVVAVLGAAAVVSGAWWATTERGMTRVAGVATFVAGAAVTASMLVLIASHAQRVFLAIAIIVVLPILAVLSGRAARRSAQAEHGDHVRSRRVPHPARPVLICNPRSGGGKVETFSIVELAKSRGIEVRVLESGDDIESLARSAIDGGADAIGVAGGDGSQGLVAAVATERDVPFVCVPAGTRNHLALDLGLNRDDPRPALDAFRDGIERQIDYATVNGRVFVNNVSLGLYASIVAHDDYRNAKLSTTVSVIPDLVGSQSEPFDLDFAGPDGGAVDNCWMLLVSNNVYTFDSLIELGSRNRLDAGKLGIAALGTEGSGDVVAMVMLGPRRARAWSEWEAREFKVSSQDETVAAGVDGESVELSTPIEFAIHPGGLRVLVPEASLAGADARLALAHRRLTLRELLRGDSG